MNFSNFYLYPKQELKPCASKICLHIGETNSSYFESYGWNTSLSARLYSARLEEIIEIDIQKEKQLNTWLPAGKSYKDIAVLTSSV